MTWHGKTKDIPWSSTNIHKMKGKEGMDIIEKLEEYLEKSNPYTSLHLLEAALATWKYRGNKAIPEELILDIQNALGDSVVQEEIINLLNLSIFERTNIPEEQGVRLKEGIWFSVEDLIRHINCNFELPISGEVNSNADECLDQFVQYLKSSEPEIVIKEKKKGDCLLELDGEIYRILLSFSPFWLPLTSEKDEEDEKYVIVFGPLSFQHWEKMYRYYDYKAFSDRVALYDPWSMQKMNLCRGKVHVYIDWFYRDELDGRLYIPEEFCEELHDRGMLRYDDEG